MPEQEEGTGDFRPVETSVNGHGRPDGSTHSRPVGSGLVFVSVVSGLTWVTAFFIVTVWSLVAFAFSRGSDRQGVESIADALYFGFPLGSIAGLWLGVRLAFRATSSMASRSHKRASLIGGGVALVAVLIAVILILNSRGPLRIAGLPVVGPALAVAGIVAPGLGAAYGKLVADRRTEGRSA